MAEKSVAQKLQMKPGRAALLVNPPPDFASLFGETPEGVSLLMQAEGPVDILLAFIRNRQELEAQLGRLKALLKPDGMLWVAYIKGTARVKTDIHRDSINAYAKTLGLQGVAMISIDQDWSALRLKVVG